MKKNLGVHWILEHFIERGNGISHTRIIPNIIHGFAVHNRMMIDDIHHRKKDLITFAVLSEI